MRNFLVLLALSFSLPLFGNTVNFKGYNFSSFYGPEILVINGLGYLETPSTAAVSNFGGGGHNTSAAFRADSYQFVSATTLEVGFGSQPSSQLWIQDTQGTLLYEAMFGSFAGGNTFRLQTRVRDLTKAGAPSIDTDDYFFTPRTSGSHTFSVLNDGGNVDWFLDGNLVASTGPGTWGVNGLGDIERVLLFAHGNADGQISTWTDFELYSVPEPSTMALAGLGLVAAVATRRLKSRA